MAQDWIIDVLADLRQYAVRNYHMRLAEHLDDAIMVAAAEIRAADFGPDRRSPGDPGARSERCSAAPGDFRTGRRSIFRPGLTRSR